MIMIQYCTNILPSTHQNCLHCTFIVVEIICEQSLHCSSSTKCLIKCFRIQDHDLDEKNTKFETPNLKKIIYFFYFRIPAKSQYLTLALKIQLKRISSGNIAARIPLFSLGYKAQICLYPKKKIGILAAILPEEIRFNFWVFVQGKRTVLINTIRLILIWFFV